MPESKNNRKLGTLVQNTRNLWVTRSDFVDRGEKPAIWEVYINPRLKKPGVFS